MKQLLLAVVLAAPMPFCAQTLPTISMPPTHLPPATATGVGSSGSAAAGSYLSADGNGGLASDANFIASTTGQQTRFYFGSAYPWHIMFPTTTYANGGGQASGLTLHMHQNAIGRSIGNVPGVGSTPWYNTTVLDMLGTFDGAGIANGITLNLQKNSSIGDFNPVRVNMNYKPGGATGASDENFKGFYFNANPLSTYKGTVNSGSSAGANDLFTTPTDAGCGAFGSAYGDKYCSGGGSYLLQTSTPIYSKFHATGGQLPTTNQYGTFTTDSAVTPSTAWTTISGLPDTTNFANGDTVTATAGTIYGSGTVPASGNACVSGNAGTVAEEMPYTYSNGTITFTKHRFLQSGGAWVFFNSCSYLTFTQDTVDNGGNMSVYIVLGATDANTLVWASYKGGARSSGSIGSGASSIALGSTIQAEFSVYPGALAVHSQDLTTAPSTASVFNPTNTGRFGLGSNTVNWTAGATVEQPYEPAVQWRLFDVYCSKNISDSGTTSVCHRETVSGNVPYWTQILLSNPIDVASRRGSVNLIDTLGLSSTAGTYNTLFNLHIAPTTALIHQDGCAGGDTTVNCANTPEQYLLQDNGKNGNGNILLHYNKLAGTMAVQANGGFSANGAVFTPYSTLPGATSADITGVDSYQYSNSNNNAAVQTCNATTRGLKRFVTGNSNSADQEQLCMKDASNNYAWHTTAMAN